MHSVHFAEWILTLVTSRDRAASTVGDLTEGAAARGIIWFWSAVLRTAASLLWRDLAENPAPVIGLAFLGFAVYIGIDLLFDFLSGIAFFIAAEVSGHPLTPGIIGLRIWLAVPILVSSLLIGRMLARLAPGRELAACLAYAIVASVYNLVPRFGDNGIFATLLCVLIVPVGAAWGRSRRLGAAQPTSL
jgi:hypothetical protein